MTLCVFTIVSANYLAYAKVLGESLHRHMPDADFQVLMVDRATPDIKRAVNESRLQVTFANELSIPDIERIAYKYDIVELNTALKPTFLKRMFEQGFSHVVYLDPDIQVFAPLTPVLDAMDKASITVTPHALHPILDGLRPSDVDFLRSGAFNFGFIALRDSDQAREMLDWWESRCLGLGFIDPAFGIFVDQRWGDLMPAYFESVEVLRHPGCNVAYWNLHERDVRRSGDRYTVAGEPLVFFHFSGVVVDNPNELSKHQTRHQIKADTPLAELVGAYCQALLDAGHASFSKLPYSFGTLDDGTPITRIMRRAMCCAVGAQETRPFAPTSPLQRRLRGVGITRRGNTLPLANISTLNFEQTNVQVRAVNAAVRLLARVFGVHRVYLLLRYAALLSRESHYPAVLIGEPLDLKHLPRR